MKKEINNFAYIDAANLHNGVNELGWKLDYIRFRKWLSDRHQITRAYLFIGLVPSNKDLYSFLQEAGYILIFKETTSDGNGNIKGNCDADLVLNAVIDFYEKEFDKALFVTSDGDYASLINFFKEKDVLQGLISPSNKCSFLLRKLNTPLTYLDTQKKKLEFSPKRKSPQ